MRHFICFRSQQHSHSIDEFAEAEYESEGEHNSPYSDTMDKKGLFMDENDSDYDKYLSGQRYSEYLFHELCSGLLDLYGHLVDRFLEQQESDVAIKQPPGKKSQQPSTVAESKTSLVSLAALNQAMAEYEYFKVVVIY